MPFQRFVGARAWRVAPVVASAEGDSKPAISVCLSGSLVRSGGVHDDRYPYQADTGADGVPPVGAEAVEGHAPEQGAGDEHAAVGGQDPAEVGVGLKGGDESVGAESDDA